MRGGGRRPPNLSQFAPKRANRFPSKPSIDLSQRASAGDEPKPAALPLAFEKVLKLARVSKVVRGGRKYRHSALVVVGDAQGRVGSATAKAADAADATAKATRRAAAAMISVKLLKGGELAYDVVGVHNATRVALRATRRGAGVRAGAAARAVLDAAGVRAVTAKLTGPNTEHNVVNAVLDALKTISSYQRV